LIVALIPAAARTEEFAPSAPIRSLTATDAPRSATSIASGFATNEANDEEIRLIVG
jgi:hypothetical protein